MKTKYRPISEKDRRRIEALTQSGSTNKEIAAIIEVSKITLGRELSRNSVYCARCYDCERAQKLSEKRRRDSKGPKISAKTWQKVFDLFNEDLSPEQISGALKLQGICLSHETIYRRIYAEIKVYKGNFLKKVSLNPSKTFRYFATMLQNE